MSRYKPPAQVPVWDFASKPEPWETERIRELSNANKQLADQVEFWQCAALVAAAVVIGQFGYLLLLALW